MDADPPFTAEALQAFSHAFSVAPDAALEQADPVTLDDVRRFLIPKIADLLDRNPALLLHILYRVDVAERDVKRVFAEASPSDLPPHLADLLIERQLLKLKTRRAYREKNA